uniref:Uncharacterized protein n=1 Tax=Terrapene triunguis TaxID=2587831 RepID=A0A674JKB4_9SAUR
HGRRSRPFTPMSYREAMDSRPPLVINVDSPGPAAYSPPTMSCRESSAPAYSFGKKTPPREGGGRRSWQKSWFQSKSPFTRKADFNTEHNVGDACFSLWLNLYKFLSPNRAQTGKNRRWCSPRLSSSTSLKCTSCWILFLSGNTPGPGLYDVEKGHIARLPSSPSVIIQGIRRPKRHETGPFTTL